jgi:hypothetical protein
MELIGIIVLIIIGFLLLSAIGWVLKILGYIFELLLKGFFKSIGCLFWIIIIIIILISIGV